MQNFVAEVKKNFATLIIEGFFAISNASNFTFAKDKQNISRNVFTFQFAYFNCNFSTCAMFGSDLSSFLSKFDEFIIMNL